MKKSTVIRLSGVLLLVFSLIMIGKYTVAGEWFVLDNITSTIKESGAWGLLMFAGLFILGSFIQIPAVVFVVAVILTYGQIEGTILGYLGVVIAMTVNFQIIRFLGGKALQEISNRRIQKLLLKLDDRPVSTIITLRLIFWAAPVLNYILAMTGVTSRDYIIGSTIGVILPVLAFSGVTYFFKDVIIPMIA